MAFSKTFPKQVSGSSYPIWEEVVLSEEEERMVEEVSKRENLRLLNECLNEAKELAIRQGINTDENRTRLAIALFEKRASHTVFWKESKAKEKFDKKFGF
jgi:hypothetical protein